MNQPNALSPLDLRPLTIGEILDRAISIYRKDFLTLAGIVALVTVPLLVIQVAASLIALPADPSQLLSSINSSPPSLNQFAPMLTYYAIILLTGIMGGVATIFQLGAVSAAVSHLYHNQETNIKTAYAQALRHWVSMLAAAFLVTIANLIVGGLFVGVVFGLPLLGAFGLSRAGSSSGASALGLLMFPLFCLGAIPAFILLIFLNIRWMFAQQVIVLENLGPVKGLGRSWRVVKGSFWRVLLIAIVLGVFIYIITAIPSSLIAAVTSLLFSRSVVLSTVVSTVSQSMLATLVTPIQFTVLTLLYYDLRVRKEGYDLELKALAMRPQSLAPAGSEQ